MYLLDMENFILLRHDRTIPAYQSLCDRFKLSQFNAFSTCFVRSLCFMDYGILMVKENLFWSEIVLICSCYCYTPQQHTVRRDTVDRGASRDQSALFQNYLTLYGDTNIILNPLLTLFMFTFYVSIKRFFCHYLSKNCAYILGIVTYRYL